MKRFAIVLAGLLAAASAWFFLSPLFIDRTANEGFDFRAQGGAVDLEKVMSLPPPAREALREQIMGAAAAARDREMSEAMPADAPRVIARGEFVDADSVHKGSGRAMLYRLADGRHVVRFEDFRTTNGPALVVYLAKHPSPLRAADVSESGFVNLGRLKGNVGNQNYFVPEDIDIAAYGSVVIWCELFGVLFSPAPLTRS